MNNGRTSRVRVESKPRTNASPWLKVSQRLEAPLSLLGPTIAGILMTGLFYGRRGLREMLARLLKWRVGAGWYAFALLIAPVITTISLLARSMPPEIAIADDKLGLLLTGIVFGVTSSPIFEESGWIGFATPELRKRFGVIATGLMMGVLWGVWQVDEVGL